MTIILTIIIAVITCIFVIIQSVSTCARPVGRDDGDWHVLGACLGDVRVRPGNEVDEDGTVGEEEEENEK